MTKVFGIEIGGKKSKEAVPEPIDHRAEVREFRTTTPSLNIIPEKVLNSYAISSIRNNFIVAAVLIVLGLGGVFGYGMYLDGQANADLEALQAETRQLQAQASELAPYGQFYNSVGEKRNNLGAVMNGEVDTYGIYTAIYDVAVQNGVTLSNVSITIAGQDNDGTVSCPTPDPFGSQTGLGCVSFDGNAGNRSAIDAFVNSLNQVAGFSNAYVPSSSSSETGSSVSGSVLFTEQFRTDRWVDYSLPLETILHGNEDNIEETENTGNNEASESVEGPNITNPENDFAPTTEDSNLFPPENDLDTPDSTVNPDDTVVQQNPDVDSGN